jgi:hypothetical protein
MMKDEAPESFRRELKNRNYSRNTIKSYLCSIKNFFELSAEKKYSAEERISGFIGSIEGFEQKRLSYQAVKLFYKIIVGKTCPHDLSGMSTKKRLPNILSRDKILEIDGNMQHINDSLRILKEPDQPLKVSNYSLKESNCYKKERNWYAQ